MGRETLSRRQLECLRGVAEHLDSHQIAERLGISPHTVDGHIASAIAALGVRSRRDAVRYLEKIAGEFPTGEFPPVVDPADFPARSPMSQVVREQPVEQSPDQPLPGPLNEGATEHHDLGSDFRTIALIAAIAVALVILLLAIEPLTESAMHLANLIQPYH